MNMLGVRRPEVYGRTTLADIEKMVRKRGEELGFDVDWRQSNYEGELITWIHETRDKIAGIIINPAGLTHTSVALYDALLIATCPYIELHMANTEAYEEYRKLAYIRPKATGVICAFGANGYVLAMDGIKMTLDQPETAMP